MIFKGVSMVFFNFRSRLWSLFVVFQSIWLFYCLPSMFDSDAICRGRTSFRGDCLPSEVDFDRYLSWPDMVCFFKLFFKSRLWSLFVVFQSNWVCYCYCLPDLTPVLFKIIAFRWCLILMLFVVAGHRLPLHAFLQKSTLNGICRSWSYFWRYNL